MRYLLVIFLCVVTIYGCNAIQHNLFYGNCAYDNNTIPMYTQVVLLDNPTAVHTPSKPARRWYDWFSNPFRRRSKSSAKTTTAVPIVSGKVINTTVVFPPHVSIDLDRICFHFLKSFRRTNFCLNENV